MTTKNKIMYLIGDDGECCMRVDNSISMEENIEKFLYEHCVELPDIKVIEVAKTYTVVSSLSLKEE